MQATPEEFGLAALAHSPILSRITPLLSDLHMPVYLVGGAVRDAVRGIASHDLDFAVPAGAVKLSFAVADALGVPAFVLDRERDTGRVVVAAEGVMLDFARFRGDNLEADLRARDFTINAMALPVGEASGANLIDPTGGLDDLRAGIVRQAHPAAITDDPLRALRAIRLKHALSLALESRTRQAVAASDVLLPNISPERVRDELIRIMQLDAVSAALADLGSFGLLSVVLPEIAALDRVAQSPPHHEPVLDHTQRVLHWLGLITGSLLANASRPPLPEPDRDVLLAGELLAQHGEGIRTHLARQVPGMLSGHDVLLWAALFHDAGKAATKALDEMGHWRFLGHEKEGAKLAARRLQALRFSGETVRHVQAIVLGHMRPLHLAQSPSLSRRAVFRFFRSLDNAGVDVVLLALADHLATYDGSQASEAEGAEAWRRLVDVCRQLLDFYFQAYEATVRPRPLLDGRTLMQALDLAGGPEVGRLLRLVEEAQATGEIATAEEALALARRASHPLTD